MTRINRMALVLALILMVSISVFGQQPSGGTLRFRGEFADTPYGTLQDGVYSMRFAVYGASTGGMRIWPTAAEYEQHVLVVVIGGKFDVELGSNGYPVTDAVSGAEDPYVQVWVCQPGGYDCVDFEPLPIRLPLYAPAYMSLETPLPGGETETDSDLGIYAVLPSGTGDAWLLRGNGGTDPTLHFLGTTDDSPFSIKVAGLTALRIEPDPTSPNLIGGFRLNRVAEHAYGATISGGGLLLQSGINEVRDVFGTIGGGAGNTVLGAFGAISGGEGNQSGPYASVAGGRANLATGSQSAIGGGYANRATESWAAVGGGVENWALGQVSFIGGGLHNQAYGEYSVIAGGDYNTASGSRAVIAGGNSNVADGLYSFVGGGLGNRVSGDYSAVLGNNNTASGDYSMIAGGARNQARGDYSFIGGRNGETTRDADGSFVWAGDHDAPFASELSNEFLVRATSGMFINAGLNAAQSYRNTNTAGLRVEVGRSDLSGWRTQMEDIAKDPRTWGRGQNPGLDLWGAAIAGLALERADLDSSMISVGVWGQSVGQGIGVLGESTGDGESAIGVMGASLNSYGVFGETQSTEEGRAGGYFRAFGTTGRTYGVVGTTNSPDGYGVYSDGDAHVEGELTWKAKTAYISIGPIDFMGSHDAPLYLADNWEWSSAAIEPAAHCSFDSDYSDRGFELFYAAPHLPQGATLVSVAFYYNEAGLDSDSWLRFGKSDFSGNVTVLSLIETHGNLPSAYHDGCDNHVVDNSTGTYWISMGLDCETTFYGVVITYEVSEPY